MPRRADRRSIMYLMVMEFAGVELIICCDRRVPEGQVVLRSGMAVCAQIAADGNLVALPPLQTDNSELTNSCENFNQPTLFADPQSVVRRA